LRFWGFPQDVSCRSDKCSDTERAALSTRRCLNDANITEVDFDGLTGLNDLELLDLSRNLLTTFNYTTLVDKPFLSTVDLSYNAIGGGLEWLNTYQDRLHFSVLNLAHNRIVAKFPFAKWSTVVDCNVAGSAGVPLSLTSLDLSYNNITCFSARVQTTSNSMLYYSAQRLSSLILSHCNLPPSADLSVIQEFMPRLEYAIWLPQIISCRRRILSSS